jgi:hypothetical protein
VTERSNPAAERVWRDLPAAARDQLESGLGGTDLQSLLLAVAAARAARVRAGDLVARWRRDRFVQPASCDPRRVSAIEARLWQLLPDVFTGVELSPVAPLGSCTALAPVSQNRIVTTMRLSEVVSDSTNALAIEAAVRRRRQPPDGQVQNSSMKAIGMTAVVMMVSGLRAMWRSDRPVSRAVSPRKRWVIAGPYSSVPTSTRQAQRWTRYLLVELIFVRLDQTAAPTSSAMARSVPPSHAVPCPNMGRTPATSAAMLAPQPDARHDSQ